MKVQDKTAFDEQNIFGQGMANTAFAQYFIGNSYLNPMTKLGESIVGLANVTFEPGCRNNWHIIMRKQAADRSSSAPQAKDGTRNGASRQED